LKLTPLTQKQMNKMIRSMPFNRLLGFRVARVYRDGLTMEMEVKQELYNIVGTLHGGATATLIDAAAGVALIGHLGGRKVTTVELKVNYLRPAAEGKIRARARFVKVGKTLAVISCEVKDPHGHLMATALVTYMLL
jgi:uncharacterized protein (TIGR00369 family)